MFLWSTWFRLLILDIAGSTSPRPRVGQCASQAGRTKRLDMWLSHCSWKDKEARRLRKHSSDQNSIALPKFSMPCRSKTKIWFTSLANFRKRKVEGRYSILEDYQTRSKLWDHRLNSQYSNRTFSSRLLILSEIAGTSAMGILADTCNAKVTVVFPPTIWRMDFGSVCGL